MKTLTFELGGFKNGKASYIVFSEKGIQLGDIIYCEGVYNLFDIRHVLSIYDLKQIVSFIDTLLQKEDDTTKIDVDTRKQLFEAFELLNNTDLDEMDYEAFEDILGNINMIRCNNKLEPLKVNGNVLLN